MRNHTCKEKCAECIIASPSSKPVISSVILLLVETEEVHVVEGDDIENKIENINCFIMPEQEAVAVEELLSTIS